MNSFENHGGPTGSDEDSLVKIDFSVSLNAFGPAPIIIEAIKYASVDTYPDPTSLHARNAASRSWGIGIESITFGAGASELLLATAHALLSPDSSVVICGPTFGEYERISNLKRAKIIKIDSLSPTVQTILEVIHRVKPSLTFVCNPNNPTGHSFDRSQLGIIAEACGSTNGLLLIDQSYDPFLSNPLGTPALAGHQNVIHLRSITKDHALAGIRAGYAVASPDIVKRIEEQRAPWSASTAAQAAAEASFSVNAQEYLSSTIPILRNERIKLSNIFTSLGIETIEGDTHTLIAKVGDAKAIASNLLINYGIKVRNCTSFGLPDYIRIAARTPKENAILTTALNEIYSA